MKKLFRTMLCVAALALMLCTSAMAAGPNDLSIEYNGEPLTFTDAAPQIVNDRTYLPFRAVFTALGFADENITYANDTRTVAAVREDLEVSMVIGENKVTIVKGGETTVLDTDVPAFIDPAVSRTFVPVSFVAQAVGYRVAWNGETRTVFIDDVEGILAANTETYEILDKYLDYSRKFQEKNYKVEGTFTASMDMLGEAMAMDGTYSMLMAGSTKFDFEMLMNMSGMVGDEDLSAAIPEGIDLSMCGDMTTGEFYFKSDLLMSMMQTGVENLWFKMDLGALMDSMAEVTGMTYADMMAMSQEMMSGLKAKTLVETMVYATAQSDPSMSAVDHLAMYNAMLGDSAYKKEKDDYVNAFAMDGVEMAMMFHTAGNKVDGYTMTMAAEEEGMGMAVEVTMKDDKMEAVFEILAEEEGMTMSMEMDGTYTATNKAPVGAPGKDAAVMDLMEMMEAMSQTEMLVEPAA